MKLYVYNIKKNDNMKNNRNNQDQLHGEKIEYWSNGAIYNKTNYINGIKHGNETYYYENGNLEKETIYL